MAPLLIAIGLALSSVPYSQNWHTDFEEAKRIAARDDNAIILVFQGSDWCTPCIKLERNIWSTNEFRVYAQKNFVMLRADFPRKKKNALSQKQEEHNERLADTYNTEGYFPYVVVLDENGKVLGTTGYKKASVKDYLAILEGFASKRKSNKTRTETTTKKPVKKAFKMMGSDFEITLVATNSEKAIGYIDLAAAEISRIERLISSWDPHSQTSAINRNAGVKPTKVDSELFFLIRRATDISKITDGAFDISYASMDTIWKFDGSMTRLPSKPDLNTAVAKIGYENIILDEHNNTVFLKTKGMRIGFGAMGKGYAADRAKELLVEQGVTSGIINASGDIAAWGTRPDGQSWQVAITNPLNPKQPFALLPIPNGAVVTSGNYQRFVTIEGKQYSHIVDPRTGYPSRGLASVTVFAPKAELADALATAVFVMGTDVGLDRINQLPDVECIVIDMSGRIFSSTNINISKP